MLAFDAPNAHAAVPATLRALTQGGERTEDMVTLPHPFMLGIRHPEQKLCFWPKMSNPFEAFFSSMKQLRYVLHKNRNDVYFRKNSKGFLDVTVMSSTPMMFTYFFGIEAACAGIIAEYLSFKAKTPLGILWLITANLYEHPAAFDKLSPLLEEVASPDPYEKLLPFPLVTNSDHFESDLAMFVDENDVIGYQERFFRRVALPIRRAYTAYKAKNIKIALEFLKDCEADDWRKACTEWM